MDSLYRTYDSGSLYVSIYSALHGNVAKWNSMNMKIYPAKRSSANNKDKYCEYVKKLKDVKTSVEDNTKPHEYVKMYSCKSFSMR